MHGLLRVEWWITHLKKPEGVCVVVSTLLVLVLVVIGLAIVRKARLYMLSERTASAEALPHFAGPDEAASFLKESRVTVASRTYRYALQTGTVRADVSELHASIHWARHFAGLLVFIGLFGTVAAMFAALANLSRIFGDSGAGDATHAIEGTVRAAIPVITGLLDGLFLASLATLTGLLGTIVLAFANARYMQGCETLRIEVERIATDTFVPLYRFGQDDYLAPSEIGSLTEAMARTESAAVRLTDQVTAAREALADMLAQSQTVSTCLEEAATGIRAEVTRALTAREDADKRVDRVDANLLRNVEVMNTVSEKVASLTDALDNVVSNLGAEHDGLEQASNVVADAARMVEREIRQLREDLASGMKDQREQLSGLAEGIRAVPEHLQRLLIEFDRVLTDVVSVSDPTHLRDAVAQASGQVQRIVGELEATTSSVVTEASGLRELSSTQTTHAAQMTRATVQLTEALRGIVVELTRLTAELRRTQVSPGMKPITPPMAPTTNQPDGHRPWTTRVRERISAIVHRRRKRQ